MKQLFLDPNDIVTIPDIIKHPLFVGLVVTSGDLTNTKYLLSYNGTNWVFVNGEYPLWCRSQFLENVLIDAVNNKNAVIYRFDTLKELSRWILE